MPRLTLQTTTVLVLAALAGAAGLFPRTAAAQPPDPDNPLVPGAVISTPAPPRWPNLPGGGVYVFFDADKTIVNGGPRDLDRARLVRNKPDEALFWFQQNGKAYAVRDAAFLAQLRPLFEPQMKLGAQQADLQQKLERLNEQQESIQEQQSEFYASQEEFGARMAALAAEQVRLQEAAEDTESIEAEIRGLEEEQVSSQEPQAELARQLEAIGNQQELLGRQREEIGRKLDKATRDAEEKLKVLVPQAIAKGTAKPVPVV